MLPQVLSVWRLNIGKVPTAASNGTERGELTAIRYLQDGPLFLLLEEVRACVASGAETRPLQTHTPTPTHSSSTSPHCRSPCHIRSFTLYP